jgi:peptidoglycan/LPS O-acetylase OafA/YrhL
MAMTAGPERFVRAPADDRMPHIDALDGVRGLAILMVMEGHFFGLPMELAGLPQSSEVDRWISLLLIISRSGVDLFFVLSGFLITGILFETKGAPSYFRSFFARRALRILPVYYGYILLVLYGLPLLSPLDRPASVDELREVQFWFWSFLTNLWMSLKSLGGSLIVVHGPLWSLAVEEQFYLVWPFVVHLLGRRALIAVCITLLAIAPVFRMLMFLPPASGMFAPLSAMMLMPARADLLGAGGLIALLGRGPSGLTWARPAARVLAPLTCAALLGLWMARGFPWFGDRWSNVWSYSLFSLFYGSLILLVLTADGRSGAHRVLVHPVLTFFGRHSYVMYVIHMLVAFILVDRLDALHRMAGMSLLFSVAGSFAPFHLLFNVVATAIVSLLAWLVWHLYEKWFLRLKVWFPADPPEVATAEHRSRRL